MVYKSKCAQHNQEIAEVMESLQKLQQQVIVKDDRMQTLTITNKQLQEQAKQVIYIIIPHLVTDCLPPRQPHYSGHVK